LGGGGTLASRSSVMGGEPTFAETKVSGELAPYMAIPHLSAGSAGLLLSLRPASVEIRGGPLYVLRETAEAS
jgi:hypothetical protein